MEQDKKNAELEQSKLWQQEQELKKIEELEELKEDSMFKTIETEIETSDVIEKKKRREVIFEMALFFVLGLLLGVTIKTEATKRITIGFNDYQIKASQQRYDVAELKKNLDEKMAEQQATQSAAAQQAPAQQ